jgi:hypothetical protein
MMRQGKRRTLGRSGRSRHGLHPLRSLVILEVIPERRIDPLTCDHRVLAGTDLYSEQVRVSMLQFRSSGQSVASLHPQCLDPSASSMHSKPKSSKLQMRTAVQGVGLPPAVPVVAPPRDPPLPPAPLALPPPPPVVPAAAASVARCLHCLPHPPGHLCPRSPCR